MKVIQRVALLFLIPTMAMAEPHFVPITLNDDSVGNTSVAELSGQQVSPGTPNNERDSNLALSIQLLRQVQANAATSNIVLSPLSIKMCLAMAYAGARSTTAEQMSGVIFGGLPPEDVNAEIRSQLQAMTGAAKPYQLGIANALWLQQDYSLRQDYLDSIGGSFGDGIKIIDFKNDPDHCLATINRWVDDQTDGKMPLPAFVWLESCGRRRLAGVEVQPAAVEVDCRSEA